MTLRRGVKQGVWHDAHPQLTAVFIPGLVRSARLFGPGGIGEQAGRSDSAVASRRTETKGVRMTLLKKAMASVAAAAVAAGLSGCFKQAAEVAKYQEVVKQGQTVSFVTGQPLSLEKALALANENNEQIGLAGEAYLQALIAKDRAAGAFMPTVALAPTWTVVDKTDAPGSAAAAANNVGFNGYTGKLTIQTLDNPVSGRMNLFNGFRDLANYRAAGENALAKRALLLDAQAALLIDVASTYYTILRSEQQVVVLRNSLDVQEEGVREMQAKLKAGVVRRLDVAQSEAQASNTRANWLAAQSSIVTGRFLLSYLLGVDAGNSPLTDQLPVPAQPLELNPLIETAMANREDLIAAQYAARTARDLVSAAIGEYYPSVSVNFNYFLYKQSAPSDSVWYSILSMNLPIFSAGQIEADVRQAWLQYRSAVLAERFTRRGVVRDVDLDRQTLITSRKLQQELEVGVAAAAEALRQAKGAQEAGTGTNLERLTAQDSLLTAQLNLTFERFNEKLAYLKLLRDLGTLSMRLPGEKTPPTMPAPPTTQMTPPNVPATRP